MQNDKQHKLSIVPVYFAEAKAFIRRHHRHHIPHKFHVFSLAVADEDSVVRGVATVGRPVARALDDGWTLEVNRLATDGCSNACSALYAAAWRVARAMGYRKLITYILAEESGVSLRAAGWRMVGEVKGKTWSSPSRPRVDKHPLQNKLRFEVSD